MIEIINKYRLMLEFALAFLVLVLITLNHSQSLKIDTLNDKLQGYVTSYNEKVQENIRLTKVIDKLTAQKAVVDKDTQNVIEEHHKSGTAIPVTGSDLTRLQDRINRSNQRAADLAKDTD